MTDETQPNRPTDETAADRQAAQQAREQEKKYGDSATAVSPDTQHADPGEALGDAASGTSSRGQSTTFDDPPKPRASSNVDRGPHGDEQPRPAGHADDDRA
ncbi:hypothetical protein GUY44_21585 [Pimelobacter simplex]|uniref:Uncharacterized protein n=1 Tax=Nocardioides simplex TaxID=2045 RepID=A0A0A1DG58_NOCSI|nr:hypothetical protein [Pimelobacter simplex]AIY16289.1 hypothetical protein KR76_05085 [Pimelobacter simplex]MCG8153088.1 hypothetical protein [Pimelobacter simplex]GEB12050.1 hypothetical protein NSI01_03650 [Pimelobacter simplex]SFN04961.1 hypothetical protein SAMN05421671_4913 [Pimelobacter simplex]